MIPWDHIVPQETDPWSMLNKPKVLNFTTKNSMKVKESLKVTPLYYVVVFAFCGASEVLRVLKTFQYSFKEEYTFSNFINEEMKSFPCQVTDHTISQLT